MKIEDLSLSDLKSAYDFVLIEIFDMKKKQKKKELTQIKSLHIQNYWKWKTLYITNY